MKTIIFKRTLITILSVLLIFAIFPIVAYAEDEKYYLGTLVNAGKDTGFSETNEIDEEDVHWNWKLGTFHVSGYTDKIIEDGKTPIFLKNVGDTVSLWFNLKQNLDCLNNNKDLSICADPDGYDKYFGIPETHFGRGALIIRHTDYQNKTHDPVIYTDYLSANATQGADVQVQLFEEGDYEVALNYEVKDSAFINMFSSYENYRIFFKFSVRNSNCMVFPIDISTGSELTNTAITPNGFRLDFANSYYLKAYVKKEMLNEGADGLIEDTRFNRSAKNGDEFTDEGIYTITVKNIYTEQETIKKIYVGTNDVLKAHTVTGLSVSEINNLIANGATIDEDGKIVNTVVSDPQNEFSEITSSESVSEISNESVVSNNTDEKIEENSSPVIPIVICVVAVIAALVIAILLKRKDVTVNNKNESEE